jgi:hypothetical protein
LKTMKIESLELANDLSIVNVSLAKIQEIAGRNTILETESDYFLVRGGCAFRALKAGGLPKILKALEVSLNPDVSRFKVVLSRDELLAFALQNSFVVFETTETYLVLGSDLLLTATKKGADLKK